MALRDGVDPNGEEGACLPPLEMSRVPILLSPRNRTSPSGRAVFYSFPINASGRAAPHASEIVPLHYLKSGEKHMKPVIYKPILRLKAASGG